MPPAPSDDRTLRGVYLSVLGTWASYALVIVVLPFRFEALGLSVFEYGAALAVYALGTLLTEGLWGYLAFRVGSPRAIAGIGALTAASMLALALPRTFAEFALVLGLYGMLVVYTTPLLRWIGMYSAGPGTASRGLGRLGLFFGIGLSVGTALGPTLYSLGGFELNVLLGTIIFAVSTLPLLALPWGSVGKPRPHSEGIRSLRALADARFVLAVTIVVLYFMAYTLVTNFLQYYSIAIFHGTPDEAGYVIGAARAVALVSGVLLGGLADRWGAERSAPIGFLVLVAGALGTWGAATYPEMVLATLGLALGAGWLSVSLLPLALSRLAPSIHGTAVGVFGSFEDLGLIIGPFLLGAVYTTLGPESLFPFTAGIAAVGGALALAIPAVGARARPAT